MTDWHNLTITFDKMESDPSYSQRVRLTNASIDLIPSNENDISKMDIKHLISIVTIFKILVEKGLVSRDELNEMEDEVKEFILNKLNKNYCHVEDKVVLDANYCVPKVYHDSDMYQPQLDGYSGTVYDYQI